MFVKNDLNQFSAKPIIQNRSFILIINMLYLIRANAFLLSRNAPLSKFVSNSSHIWMNAVTVFSSSGEIYTEIVTAWSFFT